MNITVIGAGVFGTAFATAATRAGHQVSITARRQEHAEKAAAESGATAVTGPDLAGADVVVLAVPAGAVADWAGTAGERLGGVVVVDVTNPLTDDFSDLSTSGTSAGEALQAAIPQAKVVKAFNTLFASRLTSAEQDGAPLDAFLAGDDAAAKRTVAGLAHSLGFAPRDTGGLRMARSLEELAFLNISLNAANGWAWRSAWRLAGPTAA